MSGRFGESVRRRAMIALAHDCKPASQTPSLFTPLAIVATGQTCSATLGLPERNKGLRQNSLPHAYAFKMSWPWNTPQSHLFHPPPPLPPPPMPPMGFPHPHPYSQQPLHIPFGSFSSPNQPHQPPLPPPPPFFNQPPSEHGPPSDFPPYGQHQWAPHVQSHMMPTGVQGQHIPYQQQPQMPVRRGRPRVDPRRRAQTALRNNRLAVDRVSDGVGGARKPAKGSELGGVTGAKKSGGAGGFRQEGDGSMRDAALSKAVLDKLGAKLPQDEKEIERWVAERKRNWPSRANVERKMKEKEEKEKKGALVRGSRVKGAVDKLREEYGSSEEEEEGAKKRGRKGGVKGGGIKKRRRGRGRGGKKGRDVLAGRGAEVQGTGQQSLLRRLLEKEIHKETSVLLQAFKYIASRNEG